MLLSAVAASLGVGPRGAAMLLGVAGVIAVATTSDPFVSAVVILGALLLAPLAWRIVNGRRIHPLEPLWPFLVCYGLSFVVKPLLVVQGISTYGWTNISRPEAASAVLWTAGVLVCVYLGYYSSLSRPLLSWSRRLATERSLTGVRIGALLLAVGGLASIVMVIQISGMVPSIEEIYSERFRNVFFSVLSGRGYLSLLLAMCLYAPAAQMYVALTSRRRIDAIAAVLVTILVAATALVFYSRTLILQVIIMVLVVLHFKGRWFSARMLTISGGLLLLFGGALGLRRVAGYESLWTAMASPLLAFGFLTHSFDSFEFLVPALQRTSIFGSLGGQSLIEDLFWTFIPRALVPWKPVDYGAIRVQNVLMPDLLLVSDPTQATFPAGFVSEWYVNFGLFGVVLIGILYGIVLRVAKEWVFTPEPKLLPLLVYGGIVLNLVALFRSSTQLLISAVVTVAILFVLFGGLPGRARERVA